MLTPSPLTCHTDFSLPETGRERMHTRIFSSAALPVGIIIPTGRSVAGGGTEAPEEDTWLFSGMELLATERSICCWALASAA